MNDRVRKISAPTYFLSKLAISFFLRYDEAYLINVKERAGWER